MTDYGDAIWAAERWPVPHYLEERKHPMDNIMERFELTIKIGNAGMESGPDVARALERVANRIRDGLEASGSIMDENGNTVGTYRAIPTHMPYSS